MSGFRQQPVDRAGEQHTPLDTCGDPLLGKVLGQEESCFAIELKSALISLASHVQKGIVDEYSCIVHQQIDTGHLLVDTSNELFEPLRFFISQISVDDLHLNTRFLAGGNRLVCQRIAANPCKQISAPALANAIAIAAPTPWVPPVTSARCPTSEKGPAGLEDDEGMKIA